MIKKIIKIGSSSGVVIPKSQLEKAGVSDGDEVEFSFKPVKGDDNDAISKDYKAFKKQYGQTLKNLADR